MDIYTEIILDHYKNPRNKGRMDSPTASAKEDNPMCGDKIRIDLKIETDKKTGEKKVKKVSFCGEGCAISQAAASMLTEKIEGESLEKVKSMNEKDVLEMLGIPISPGRMKCALLAFYTIKIALKNGGATRIRTGE